MKGHLLLISLAIPWLLVVTHAEDVVASGNANVVQKALVLDEKFDRIIQKSKDNPQEALAALKELLSDSDSPLSRVADTALLVIDRHRDDKECEALFANLIKTIRTGKTSPEDEYHLAVVAFNIPCLKVEAIDILIKLVEKHPDFEKADYSCYLAGWMMCCVGDIDAANKWLVVFEKRLPGNEWVTSLKKEIEEQNASKKGHWPDGRVFDPDEGWEDEESRPKNGKKR